MEFQSKRSQTKKHNRRVIMDAARDVFSREGYRTTTVRDIISATPLASGTFYNYFKSKEEVYVALRDELALELRPSLRSARQNARTADDFIAGTFRGFLSYVAKQPESFAAINAREDQASAGTRLVVMGTDDLRQDVQSAIQKGLFADVDAELLAAAIMGVASEVAEVMRKRKQSDMQSTIRFCSELILRGLPSLPARTEAWLSEHVV